MNLATLPLAALSGLLSTLSPCVLPLLPIVISTAAAAHRYGALALGVGLTLSFTVLGLFVATVGVSLGLTEDVFRLVAGILLIGFAALLLIPPLQAAFMRLASGLANRGGQMSAKVDGSGWHGQFVVGLILGMVWTPCVGPTLGAAATLASAGQNLSTAALVMLVFGLGAALPLIVIGSLSRQALMRVRGRLQSAARGGKQVLGVLFLLVGLGIVSGYDHMLEAWLVDHSPAWLTALTTRY
ncbi:cytochrome c biogenesis CcdA family protein [Nevskia ramosa]|uniref:cytochrome c biogenesis CcdA family protein n=1 Tax=Nevskia ramosa TaxID=64002 RepID=UPI0003B4FB47|nr:cytochrome c biogenesis CcdA family protein [Nevskia ramosa]